MGQVGGAGEGVTWIDDVEATAVFGEDERVGKGVVIGKACSCDSQQTAVKGDIAGA